MRTRRSSQHGLGVQRLAALAFLAAAVCTVGVPTPSAATEKSAKPGAINVEKTYYAQYLLLGQAMRRVAKHRPGVPDLYFVGFAGDAHQDVFLREMRSVGRLFERRFDTKGRSLLLINNVNTTRKYPLANSHNLLTALQDVGNKMDKNEDVLFLFITTHGEPDVLSVNFKPLQLNNITAQSLKYVLDQSRIKWRILVVSACYSGSFIDDLKDENSLILTAARADRVSFGCSHENDFTYFGRAYFDQALRGTFSFLDAYNTATATIGQWEKSEKLKPSEPQIHVGAAIRPKLKEIETRLRARFEKDQKKSAIPRVCCAPKAPPPVVDAPPDPAPHK